MIEAASMQWNRMRPNRSKALLRLDKDQITVLAAVVAIGETSHRPQGQCDDGYYCANNVLREERHHVGDRNNAEA
jgi:hypothetical protein